MFIGIRIVLGLYFTLRASVVVVLTWPKFTAFVWSHLEKVTQAGLQQQSHKREEVTPFRAVIRGVLVVRLLLCQGLHEVSNCLK